MKNERFYFYLFSNSNSAVYGGFSIHCVRGYSLPVYCRAVMSMQKNFMKQFFVPLLILTILNMTFLRRLEVVRDFWLSPCGT